ncbi:MAG: hypothetical protein C4336_06930 [Armatimonadota bacterium]
MRESNPLLWYHLIGWTRHRYQQQRVLFYTIAFVIMLLYATALTIMLRSLPETRTVVNFVLFLVCLLTPLFSYNLFSTEYEKATWEFLALTRLSAKQILLGKWLTGMVRLGILFVGLLPFLLVIDSAKALDQIPTRLFLYQILLALLCVFSWGTLLITAGVWISFRWRSTVLSASLLYGLQIFILLLLPFLAAIFNANSDREGTLTVALQSDFRSFSERILFWVMAFFNGQFVVWFNPFYTLHELYWMMPHWRWDYSGNWEQTALAMRAVGWGWVQSLVYLLLSAGFWGLTYNGIRKHWRK